VKRYRTVSYGALSAQVAATHRLLVAVADKLNELQAGIRDLRCQRAPDARAEFGSLPVFDRRREDA
jgi:hypothetical protein